MHSIRTQIIAGLALLFVFTFLIILVFNGHYITKHRVAHEVSRELDHLQNIFLRDTRVIYDFLKSDVRNPDFYRYDSTKLIKLHESLILQVRFRNQNRNIRNLIEELELTSAVDSLFISLEEYNRIIDNLMLLLKVRGFKDFGIEGRMRRAIHKLERVKGIDRAQVLSLRRHEKDYIIRNEAVYIENLLMLSASLTEEISSNKNLHAALRDSALRNLSEYTQSFLKLVEYDRLIGINSHTGIKPRLDSLIVSIDNQFTDISQIASKRKDAYFSRLQGEYAVFFVLLFLSVLVISLYIATVVSKPIKELANNVNDYVSSNFTSKPAIQPSKVPREIAYLISSFSNMILQLEFRELARKDAENNVKANEIKYRELADMLPVGIFETDANGFFTFVNRAWVQSLGYNKVEVKNKITIKQLLLRSDYPKLFNGNRTNQIECGIIRNDGSILQSMVIVSTFSQNGQRKGYRGIIIDNTERNQMMDDLRREKARAEQSDKLKTAFLANMSHEIRTPMNAIIGFSNLLSLGTGVTDTQKEYIDIIKKSGEHLLKLIDDIIDIAKIESGELTVSLTECNPLSLAGEVHTMFSKRLNFDGKEEVEVRLQAAIPGELIIYTDPFRLKQILVNLMGNALKFTSKGYIELSVQWHNFNEILFSVRDTGIGIDPKKQDDIFQAFKQANESIAPQYGGNGLGLAISRNLVNLLGGNMWVESEIGKGSTFHFTIPYVPAFSKAEEVVTIPSTDEAKLSGRVASDLIILVAEDNDSNFRYIKDYLSIIGCSVIRARNGLEALEICKKTHVDMIFMDIHMPKLNGYEAASNIRQFQPSVPIIALTAFAFVDEKQRCIASGCNDYLSKPVSPDDLKRVLQLHLANSDIALSDYDA